METLIHGGDIYSLPGGSDVLDFSANINPLGLAGNVRQSILNSVENCVNYPDPLCRRLKKCIAGWEDVEPDEIVCGNGAADVIYRLVSALRPKKALLIAPGFADYETALAEAGCALGFYKLKEENGFRLDSDFLECIYQGLDIVFICNPNNPTGVLVQPDLMRRILDQCTCCGTLLVVDECFNDFLEGPEEHTMKPFLKQSNLFLLKAFTKIFAVPGLRLGYGLCGNKRIIDMVSRCGQAWSVSVVAQEAGAAAVLEKDYVLKTRRIVAAERDFLKSWLIEFGFNVYDSRANFIFFKSKANGLQEFLLSKRILIRSCANYRGLSPDFYRIAVRLHPQNEKLICAIGDFLKGK